MSHSDTPHRSPRNLSLKKQHGVKAKLVRVIQDMEEEIFSGNTQSLRFAFLKHKSVTLQFALIFGPMPFNEWEHRRINEYLRADDELEYYLKPFM